MSHLNICQKKTNVFFYIFPKFFPTFFAFKILSKRNVFLPLNKNHSMAMAMILFREDKINNKERV